MGACITFRATSTDAVSFFIASLCDLSIQTFCGMKKGVTRIPATPSQLKRDIRRPFRRRLDIISPRPGQHGECGHGDGTVDLGDYTLCRDQWAAETNFMNVPAIAEPSAGGLTLVAIGASALLLRTARREMWAAGSPPHR